MTPPRRTYTSTNRARAAEETRAAILRAAGELFTELGYTRATVAGIAERAQVALNTVYTSVGGKPALIEALARQSSEDARIDSAMAATLAATDGREILRITARGTGEVTRRQSAVLRVLVDNAASDPAVAAAAELATNRYRERVARVAAHLVEVGAVHVGVARCEQILWFYFGTTAWASVRDFGWDWADAADWLGDQAAAALLTEG
jgi:AcrR family transcriptional regulator